MMTLEESLDEVFTLARAEAMLSRLVRARRVLKKALADYGKAQATDSATMVDLHLLERRTKRAEAFCLECSE